MKLKVLFLKKKYLYYTGLLLIIIILLAVFLGTKKTLNTFNTVTDNKSIFSDLTGDGKDDILYINTNKDKYYINVNTNDESFSLKPNDKLNSLGTYSSFWPMKITLMDINRNKQPEIFLQSSDNSAPLQHLFIWSNNTFKDIFCSSNNILGFVDCKNNRTPKLISANISKGTFTQNNYILINDELNSFNLNTKDNFLGRDTILLFIKYIESLPNGEAKKPVQLFYPGITGKELTPIGKMSAEKSKYVFQDGLFMDTSWNKDGDATEVSWTLNFQGISAASNVSSRYSIKINLKSTDDANSSNYFKINSISLE